MPDPVSSAPPPEPTVAVTHDAFAAARAEALEDAADAARLAPSVHNTQPWILELGPTGLSLRVDRSRQLTALDPHGRELTMSVGAALLNARAALAERGWAAEVQRLPQAEDPDLLARIRPVPGRPDSSLAALAAVIRRRHTNRRRFLPELLPDDVVQRLADAVSAEDTRLVAVVDDEHRRLVGQLTREADRAQNSDPDYRCELHRWTGRPRHEGEGVPASQVPRADPGRRDELPIRDFDTRGTGELPSDTASGIDQTILLLATRDDDRHAWLRAGEAMERLLLELTLLGWAAGPMTQAVEVPATRARLGTLTGQAYPQALVRAGHAARVTTTPRRPRGAVVRNSRRSDLPLYARTRPSLGEQTPQAGPAERRRVSDGRGGTTWT